MLTSDENVVRVEMNVQYRVTNPEKLDDAAGEGKTAGKRCGGGNEGKR